MIYRLCQTCNPLPSNKIFLCCTQETWEIIHCQPSDCEQDIKEDDVLPIRWEELKNEYVLPEDYRCLEPSEPDVILSIQDQVGILSQITDCLFNEFQLNILAGQINGRKFDEHGIFLNVQFSQEYNQEQITKSLDQLCQQLTVLLNIQLNNVIRNSQNEHFLHQQKLYFKVQNKFENDNQEVETQQLHIVAVDRLGLTFDITRCLFNSFQANLIEGHLVTNNNYATFDFKFYLESFSNEEIENLCQTISKIPSVFIVYLYSDE